jgi:hypothetical protein
MSPKQEIYQEMLRVVFMYVRSVAALPWYRRIGDRSLYCEIDLVHNLTTSMFEDDFVAHDLWFLNWQARHYCESYNPNICPLYLQQIDLIRRLFQLVPSELREQLKWGGPSIRCNTTRNL